MFSYLMGYKILVQGGVTNRMQDIFSSFNQMHDYL